MGMPQGMQQMHMGGLQQQQQVQHMRPGNPPGGQGGLDPDKLLNWG
jgi:hypothetical protein